MRYILCIVCLLIAVAIFMPLPVPAQEAQNKVLVDANPTGVGTTRRTDTHTDRRDKAQPHENWEGSFGVKGVNTRFKLGGFAELDVIHDSDAIGSKGQFNPSNIVTRDATKIQGSDGQTSFSVNPTRLYVETRTPITQHRLTTFISMDLFGDSLSVSPEPRLRQGYGELTKILFGGDLLAGQAWSSFADMEAWPDVLNFSGPNSFFGLRQALVRWTRGVGEGLNLMVAAETPDNHIIQDADALTAWPDGVASMTWDKATLNLMGSFVARDLRASFNNGPTQSAFGWGGSVSGKWAIPVSTYSDTITFSAAYGKGIGSCFNDPPPDAVFNSAGDELDAIPVFGWFLSYKHWWSGQFYSTLMYGALEVDNRAEPRHPNHLKRRSIPVATWFGCHTKTACLGWRVYGVNARTKTVKKGQTFVPSLPPGSVFESSEIYICIWG